MKKYLLTIILIILIAISYSLNNFNFSLGKIEAKKEEAIKVEETTNEYIYVYDKKYNRLNKLEVNNLKSYISIADYIKLILENTKALSKNISLLAVYEFNDSLIIKFSEDFSRLSKEEQQGIYASLRMSLTEKFIDIRDIIIQTDTNN